MYISYAFSSQESHNRNKPTDRTDLQYVTVFTQTYSLLAAFHTINMMFLSFLIHIVIWLSLKCFCPNCRMWQQIPQTWTLSIYESFSESCSWIFSHSWPIALPSHTNVHILSFTLLNLIRSLKISILCIESNCSMFYLRGKATWFIFHLKHSKHMGEKINYVLLSKPQDTPEHFTASCLKCRHCRTIDKHYKYFLHIKLPKLIVRY